MALKPTEIFQSVWTKGTISQEYKDAAIIHLYKRRGHRQSYKNYWGISLLSVGSKILIRILLNTLNKCSCLRVSVASGKDAGL